MTTFKRGKTLNSQTRAIVHNVTAYFEEEKSTNSLKIPISNAIKRTAEATGVSASTVKKIKREMKSLDDTENSVLSTPGKHRNRPSFRNCNVDDFDRCVIRQTIQDFYIKEKCVPSISKLLPVLKDKINFEWKRESLRKILHSMNFRWKKCVSSRKILIERPDIVFWRFKYLKAMKKFREEKRCLVYIDETWVDGNLTYGKCWQDDFTVGVRTNTSSKNRLIVVHAGSSDGFIDGAELVYKASSSSGDYHGQMNGDQFEKWINEKLLPNLQPNSVVCMDNAPYHTVKADRIPTKYSTKGAMLEWLNKNKISHDTTMRKADLFEIVSKHAPKSNTYRVDRILVEAGHEIARLPPYHCDLNPIEYIWSSVKRRIREKNVTGDLSLNNLQQLLKEAFSKTTPNEWKKHCEHIEKVEDMYWKKDGLIEDIVDDLVIHLSGSDSDSSSSTDTASDSDMDSDNISTNDPEFNASQVIKKL